MSYDNETGMTGGATSVSALFDNRADAQDARDRLVQAGIPNQQIRIIEGDGSAETGTTTTTADREKGFWESLGDFFFPDEDRYSYAEGLSRGGYLVAVTGLSQANYETALDILDDEGTVNLEEREASWRAEGWGGYEASPYAASSVTSGTSYDTEATEPVIAPVGTGTRDTSLSDNESIPVVEERLRVGKRDASHGRVRVRAYTVEEPITESVDLREDRVEIERRPVDRAVTGTEAAFQDRTLEAEEYREEAVVSKEARVVEEVGLRKTSDTHRETISDTVRHTEVEIEDDRDDLDKTRK
ncbi:YsnF/AvaK domain-containing protein [Cereibacter sp. SYSU M97828]|nr:YsnF/AvaK domain-containing protein [Cereibacter flavus]